MEFYCTALHNAITTAHAFLEPETLTCFTMLFVCQVIVYRLVQHYALTYTVKLYCYMFHAQEVCCSGDAEFSDVCMTR